MLSNQQIQSWQYFVGKVCTIITSPINRNFSEKILLDYFLGRIKKFDEMGIWYEHLNSKKMNFVFYSYVVTVAEETEIKPVSNQTGSQLPSATELDSLLEK